LIYKKYLLNLNLFIKFIHIFYMTNIQLVVARFNENLDWLLILKNLDIIIYNKGEENIDYIKYNLNKYKM